MSESNRRLVVSGPGGTTSAQRSLRHVEKPTVVGFGSARKVPKMTAEQFESVLKEIGRRQGTPTPLVQVTTAATIVRGRVTQADVDRTSHRRNAASPFGVVAIEQPGLVPGPLAFVQIADIPEGGVCELAPHKTINKTPAMTSAR